MNRKFIRKKEDFTCENCGVFVKGSGYTNHCPKCLWSKHVDINPGDRENACGGLMKPIRIEMKGREYMIVAKCVKCGLEKRNKTDKEDDMSIIMKVSRDGIFVL